jgi:hypothetical protein
MVGTFLALGVRTRVHVSGKLFRLVLRHNRSVAPQIAVVNLRERLMDQSIVSWIIVAASALGVVFIFMRFARTSKLGLANQAEGKQRAEKLLELTTETNQLLRELIATVRDKR